jgi:hypothetical protein
MAEDEPEVDGGETGGGDDNERDEGFDAKTSAGDDSVLHLSPLILHSFTCSYDGLVGLVACIGKRRIFKEEESQRLD